MSNSGKTSADRPAEELSAQSQLAGLARTLVDLDAQLTALPSDSHLEPWRTELSAALKRAELQIVSDKSIKLELSWSVEDLSRKIRREEHEIIARIIRWAGGAGKAYSWYRSQPIAAFGERTAESLVKSGQASALRDYLDSVAVGGFA